jgi:aryl-alcohol dehydrogenase-like predicted oxidoreductase
MRYRTFGTSGLRVSELFLGAMTFGEQGGVSATSNASSSRWPRPSA